MRGIAAVGFAVGVGLLGGCGSDPGVTGTPGGAAAACAVYSASVQHEDQVYASWKAATPNWQANDAVVPAVRDAFVAAGDQYRTALALAPAELHATFQTLVTAHDAATAEGGVTNANAEHDAAIAVEAACAAAGFPVVRAASA